MSGAGSPGFGDESSATRHSSMKVCCSVEQLGSAALLGMVVLAPDAETLEAPEAEMVVWSPC